ncbi:MAG: hypothetical protein AAF652_03370 [Cyanobacteria bacterium P01_C01_bin.72]
MPQITQTKRGRLGTWKTGKKPQKITVNINSNIIRQNIKKSKFERKPAISVKGQKKIYVHQLEIPAPCRIIYDPDKPLDCLGAHSLAPCVDAGSHRCGARVWIEILDLDLDLIASG